MSVKKVIKKQGNRTFSINVPSNDVFDPFGNTNNLDEPIFSIVMTEDNNIRITENEMMLIIE